MLGLLPSDTASILAACGLSSAPASCRSSPTYDCVEHPACWRPSATWRGGFRRPGSCCRSEPTRPQLSRLRIVRPGNRPMRVVFEKAVVHEKYSLRARVLQRGARLVLKPLMAWVPLNDRTIRALRRIDRLSARGPRSRYVEPHRVRARRGPRRVHDAPLRPVQRHDGALPARRRLLLLRHRDAPPRLRAPRPVHRRPGHLRRLRPAARGQRRRLRPGRDLGLRGVARDGRAPRTRSSSPATRRAAT